MTQTNDVDPTAYNFNSIGSAEYDPSRDPQVRYIRGFSNHGGGRIEMPFITPVAENLYHGGLETGLVLPEHIKYVVSMYPWEQYIIDPETQTLFEYKMYDSVDQSFEDIPGIAQKVNELRKEAPVLVHCQAGLNRSSLVVAKALLLSGEVKNGREAVDLIRAKRSPVCLSNPAFEAWVLAHE